MVYISKSICIYIRIYLYKKSVYQTLSIFYKASHQALYLLYVYLPIRRSRYIFQTISMYLRIYISIYISFYVSFCLSFYISISIWLYLYIYPISPPPGWTRAVHRTVEREGWITAAKAIRDAFLHWVRRGVITAKHFRTYFRKGRMFL